MIHNVAVAYLLAVVLVALATGVGMLVRAHLAAPDFVMLYLLVIGAIAARCGRWPSLFASAASVLAYDFFFVPPYHTFAVSDTRHLLTFAMMFVVGITISSLMLARARLADAANAAAIRAHTEQMRSDLLSMVSHDLRTPLAAITGAATTLRDGSARVTDDQRADLLDTICEEAERLERLVRNLLDMTRLESGAVAIKREWVPLEEVVGSALTRMEADLARRVVNTALPPDLPLVSVDPVLLEQLFVNLLENTVKYTPDDSAIDIVARAERGQLIIELADRGPGVPRDVGARAFDRFTRGRHAGIPGAGLGLAICRSIAAAHDGALALEDRPGGGAVFRVVLPLLESPPTVPTDREPVVAEKRRAS